MADYLYGSIPYTYGSAAPAIERPPVPETPVREPEAAPAAPRIRVGAAERAEPRNRVHISVFALLGIPAVLVSMLLLLRSYIQLTQLSDEAAGLEQSVAQLEESRNRLEIEYEQAYDMAEVETYAKTTLGMVKAGSDQTSYLRSAEGDQAQILAEADGTSSWQWRLKAFLRKLEAYFR